MISKTQISFIPRCYRTVTSPKETPTIWPVDNEAAAISQMTRSLFPFCWAATKLRMTSIASWWALLFCSFACSSMASYVSLSAKSFRLYLAGACAGPSHLSTSSWSFSNPWVKSTTSSVAGPWVQLTVNGFFKGMQINIEIVLDYFPTSAQRE